MSEVNMYEGTNAVLHLNNKAYELSHYKITEDPENHFCYNIEMVVCDKQRPIVTKEESYTARLQVNGDAVWYFPWLWLQNNKKSAQLKGNAHGAIFCPFGLTEEEENRYEALNLIIVSDVCYSMTEEVWQNLLLIFSDWLKAKSIPQYKEYVTLSDEVDEDEDDDTEDEDDDTEDEDDDYNDEDDYDDDTDDDDDELEDETDEDY